MKTNLTSKDSLLNENLNIINRSKDKFNFSLPVENFSDKY